MKSSSMVSRVYFRRPGVRALVPDLKLVLVVLTVGCESHVGVYRPAGLAEDAGLDLSALAGALADLEHRAHIARDSATGEVFLCDFFRDNSFKTAARRGQARGDFGQIESAPLRVRVLRAVEQNPSCGLSKADLLRNQIDASQGEGEGEGEGKGEAAAPRAPARGTADAAATTAQIGKRRMKRDSGIVTWDAEDIRQAERLEHQHPADLIHAAVAALAKDDKEPVPGLVTREIERQQRLRAACERGAAAEAERQMRLQANPCESDLGAVERGYNLLPEKLRAHVKQKLEDKNAQA